MCDGFYEARKRNHCDYRMLSYPNVILSEIYRCINSIYRVTDSGSQNSTHICFCTQCMFCVQGRVEGRLLFLRFVSYMYVSSRKKNSPEPFSILYYRDCTVVLCGWFMICPLEIKKVRVLLSAPLWSQSKQRFRGRDNTEKQALNWK